MTAKQLIRYLHFFLFIYTYKTLIYNCLGCSNSYKRCIQSEALVLLAIVCGYECMKICIGNLIYFGTAITIESKKFLYVIIYFIKFFLNLSFKKTVHYNIKL